MLPPRPNAVITGAAGGLGRALAQRLASRGAQIVLADIDTKGAEETRRIVESTGGRGHVLSCDVAKREDMERLANDSEKLLGPIDFLANNAGVAVGGPVGTIPLADWDWIVGINMWGVIYGCHYFLPKMKERGRGHILNVASIAAFASAAEMAPYNMTKASVVAMSETLASELNGTGVGCTVLCPYFFTTNIAKSARSHAKMGSHIIEKIMAKNPVQADQVAEKAIVACEKNALYVFPHTEAKTINWLKRSVPEALHRHISPWLARRMG